MLSLNTKGEKHGIQRTTEGAPRENGGPRGHRQDRTPRQPHRGDKVFDYDGARIFLGPNALDAVRGKMLDAVLDDSGRIQFQLTPQAMAVADAQVA